MENETQFYYATEDTYAIAAELSEQGFEENQSAFLYDECDTLFINTSLKKYDFTIDSVVSALGKDVVTKKINLKTIEQWKTN